MRCVVCTSSCNAHVEEDAGVWREAMTQLHSVISIDFEIDFRTVLYIISSECRREADAELVRQLA